MSAKDELDPNEAAKKSENKPNVTDKNVSKQQQNINSLPIRAYLDQTVVPLVSYFPK